MPRLLGAVAAMTLLLACPAHGDEALQPKPVRDASRSGEQAAENGLPAAWHRATYWLFSHEDDGEADSPAPRDLRPAAKPFHTGTVTEVRYPHLLEVFPGLPAHRSLDPAPAEAQRTRLDLPPIGSSQGALKVRFTGGVDAIGLLFTKRM